MAVEPDVGAGELNVPGGPLLDIFRLEPVCGELLISVENQ